MAVLLLRVTVLAIVGATVASPTVYVPDTPTKLDVPEGWTVRDIMRSLGYHPNNASFPQAPETV